MRDSRRAGSRANAAPEPLSSRRAVAAITQFEDRAELWSKMPDDVLASVALLGGDTRLLDQLPAALVPVAVAVEAALALGPCCGEGAG
jgi:hypothetical protein